MPRQPADNRGQMLGLERLDGYGNVVEVMMVLGRSRFIYTAPNNTQPSSIEFAGRSFFISSHGSFYSLRQGQPHKIALVTLQCLLRGKLPGGLYRCVFMVSLAAYVPITTSIIDMMLYYAFLGTGPEDITQTMLSAETPGKATYFL